MLTGFLWTNLLSRCKIEHRFTGSVSNAVSAAKRTNAKFLIACGLQLITMLVMLSRALSNPFSSSLSISCSVGVSFSSVVEIGTFIERGGAAEGEIVFISPCQNQKMW